MACGLWLCEFAGCEDVWVDGLIFCSDSEGFPKLREVTMGEAGSSSEKKVADIGTCTQAKTLRIYIFSTLSFAH